MNYSFEKKCSKLKSVITNFDKFNSDNENSAIQDKSCSVENLSKINKKVVFDDNHDLVKEEKSPIKCQNHCYVFKQNVCNF